MLKITSEVLKEAKKLIEEGKLKETKRLILDLEKRNDLSPQELLSYKLLKAELLYRSFKFLDTINYTDQLLKEIQDQGDLLLILDVSMIQSFAQIMLGNVIKSEALIKKARILFNRIKETSNIDLRERESFLIRIIANICTWKGKIHRSLEFNKRAFELAKGSNNRERTSASLINIAEKYQILGDYDNAKTYAEQAIDIQYQPLLIYEFGDIIDILLEKGDIGNAKIYFQQIDDIRKKDDNKINNTIYRYYKALFLKTSLRSKNRVESEELLKQIIDNEDVSGGIKTFWGRKRIFALINLCDLLLIELRLTNYPEIIDEIQIYIRKLLDFAKLQHSYWVLCETHLLQAKLALIRLDLDNARRFLTKAQKLAEKYGLNNLAMKISNEHDELLRQLNVWENLKESKASLSERIKLANLNEQMENVFRKRTIDTSELSDENPVLILIVSEGGQPIFSQPFIKEWSFENHLFGGFLTAINSFSDEIFSKGLERAKFGDYTVILKSVPPFLIFYLFKGQSFQAQKRVRYFAETIQKENEIWQKLQKFYETNQEIQLNDIPLLNTLLNDVFINKLVP
ncbi:MAG: tetratricopeptide repeat protein [Candidatus Hermodarchaeota archaeon]